MRFKNGIVFCEDGVFRKRAFSVKGEVFSDTTDTDETVDLKDKLILPGLIDSHIHGAAGCDFTCDTFKDLKKMSEYLAANGITSFVPTSLTAPTETLKAAYKNARELRQTESGAKIAGINMEGPFLSAQKKGAQPAEFLRLPDYDLFCELNRESGGIIKIVTIAPELKGAVEFIGQAKNVCTVSAGHTCCDYLEAKSAFKAGISRLTHLFNAMPPFLHREPGIIGAATEEKSVFAELICDGIHVHESAVRAAFNLFQDRIILVSDSLSVCGAQGGEYYSGTSRICLKNGAAALDDGTLAGSALNLFECMKKAISFGISAETAITAATKNPALQLNIYNDCGSITTGKRADFIVCNKDFLLEAVYIGGKLYGK